MSSSNLGISDERQGYLILPRKEGKRKKNRRIILC
jgi:hypothetical protein